MASKRANRIWKRLMDYYGAPRIAEHFGDKPPDEWCALIDRTDDERLETALVKIRREHVNYPPSLGQFEAAIPEKRVQLEGPSVSVLLVRHAVANLSLCKHQLMMPWSHFGPEREFTSKSRGGEILKHADPQGVVIPSCSVCEKPSSRVKLEDLADHAA